MHYKANAKDITVLYNDTRIGEITDGTNNTSLSGEGIFGRLTGNDLSGCPWWIAGVYGDTIAQLTQTVTAGLARRQ